MLSSGILNFKNVLISWRSLSSAIHSSTGQERYRWRRADMRSNLRHCFPLVLTARNFTRHFITALLGARAGARGHRREHDGMGTSPPHARSCSGPAARRHTAGAASAWLLERPWTAWRGGRLVAVVLIWLR